MAFTILCCALLVVLAGSPCPECSASWTEADPGKAPGSHLDHVSVAFSFVSCFLAVCYFLVSHLITGRVFLQIAGGFGTTAKPREELKGVPFQRVAG